MIFVCIKKQNKTNLYRGFKKRIKILVWYVEDAGIFINPLKIFQQLKLAKNVSNIFVINVAQRRKKISWKKYQKVIQKLRKRKKKRLVIKIYYFP